MPQLGAREISLTPNGWLTLNNQGAGSRPTYPHAPSRRRELMQTSRRREGVYGMPEQPYGRAPHEQVSSSSTHTRQ